MFVNAYLNTAVEILKLYKGEEPLSSFLKKFFVQHKKFGSRDRKQISHLCYCFFRLGKSLRDVTTEERIAIGLFLCSTEKNQLLEKLKPEWNEVAAASLAEKMLLLQYHYFFQIENIFSLASHVTPEIEFSKFSSSILLQPDTFLRIRPGKENIVVQKLAKSNIPFEKLAANCIAVAPATKLDQVLEVNKEVVVQDLSSQKVLNPYFEYGKQNDVSTAWDCCAASGGKSILLKDHYPNIQLTVSDVRESILVNLHKRFKEANITGYHSKVFDVAAEHFLLKQKFDLIICDVPCSGSGTWGRTPEQLYFFDEKKVEHYTTLQKKIVRNAAKSLKKGSSLVYITCSVFKEENEQVVEFIQKELKLNLISSTYFKGYQQRADTLFSALFTL